MSAEKQIKRLKFQPKNEEYKLVSINPADIIGADQLWLFNTKYRRLTVYNSMGPAGLSIKGTTLQGYDPDDSYTKTVRKPDDVLPNVLKGGKRILKNLMSTINSKESQPNGRINGETVLLRVAIR